MMAGGGQVGAGLALYLKSKNKKLKKFVAESIPVGILGVGEPLMYAVTLPLVKPFITACLGAGFGGVVAALCHIGTVSQGVSGLFGLLIVVPGQQLVYVLAMLAAYAGGFVLTWFFGVDEERIERLLRRVALPRSNCGGNVLPRDTARTCGLPCMFGGGRCRSGSTGSRISLA